MRAPAFWSGRDGAPGLAAALALTPASWLYAAAGRLRRAVTRPYRAAVPVVCVGNLVTGGAGKTPTVLAICDRLHAMGLEPHILTRGYGGSVRGPHRVDLAADDARRVGDEPVLMARRYPVWVGGDRRASAEAAVADGAEILVMDDGFQNPTIEKDIALLVVDAGFGYGNGRVMPAGPLREPIQDGYARADAVIVIGAPAKGQDWPWIPPGLPALYARLTPQPTKPPLAGRRVLAFAGIGRPEKFFDTLRGLGARVVEQEAFPDHHPYAAPLLARLEARAERLDAMLATTEKDAARLPRAFLARCVVLPVSLGFEEPGAVDALLETVLEPE